MKNWAILLLSVMLAACSTPPVQERQAESLFNDQLFASPSQRISADDVFALSPAMKHYLNVEIAGQLRAKGRQQGLFNALYRKGQLRLEYDSAQTRNAAQTFEARTGNCLSLVIMTAALAKEIGLSIQYNSVSVDETWSRSGDIYFSSRHVNLTLGPKRIDMRAGYNMNPPLTIDFLPPEELDRQRARSISEETIVAMYMNNRAAESLVQGQLADAYWWAREAIRQAPAFLTSYNTLGVVYRRHGNAPQAEQVFRHVLALQPGNTMFMYNLVQVLNDLGRMEESRLLALELERLQPYPPYYFFNLGMEAMQREDFKAAKDLFAKEVARDPYNHEFQFRLATAYFSLGEIKQADRHLQRALENSTTHSDRGLYAAKLERLKSYHVN
jgi:Tfp pilus assembly protein PilF